MKNIRGKAISNQKMSDAVSGDFENRDKSSNGRGGGAFEAAQDNRNIEVADLERSDSNYVNGTAAFNSMGGRDVSNGDNDYAANKSSLMGPSVNEIQKAPGSQSVGFRDGQGRPAGISGDTSHDYGRV